jgi:ribose-phosphate pyrophosphokinase
MYGDIVLFAGNANPGFADRLAQQMNRSIAPARVSRFSDGEIWVELKHNVRGQDVFLVQSTCTPASENLMELLIMAEAAKRSSAGRVTAVIPYFGYARQDRKVKPRTPITARLVADLLQAAGIDRVLTMDLHAGQIQGFFDIPVDNLYAQPPFFMHIRDNIVRGDPDSCVMVSPDAGGVERARSYAARLGCGLAIIDKRRDRPNSSNVMHIVGEVEGKRAILLDDMIDTAGTLTTGARAIHEAGASEVLAIATHPVLSGPAVERLTGSVFQKVMVTDTIPLSEEAQACGKLEVVSVADLFADAIRAIHTNDSVSRLFLQKRGD